MSSHLGLSRTLALLGILHRVLLSSKSHRYLLNSVYLLFSVRKLLHIVCKLLPLCACAARGKVISRVCYHPQEIIYSCSSKHEPIDDLYQHNILLCFLFVHISRKHMATIDRRGYGGQQRGTIVMLVDRVHQFEAY